MPTDETLERRVIGLTQLRADDGETPKIVGYIATFNRWSVDLGGFVEQISPGAFARTIQEADIHALWQHNPDYVLGRTRNGTLTLREDATGLWAEITPPETTWARDAVASIRRGDVDQASFGFTVCKGGEQWDWNVQPAQRTLLEVELHDVSPVTFPAYPSTSLAVRAWVDEHTARQAPGEHDASVGARARRARRKKILDLLSV